MPHSTPKKGDVAASVATLVGKAKKLPLEDLKHVLSTVTHKMEERRISLAHFHDLYSVLHN